MKKNTAPAIETNVISAVMNDPYLNSELWIENVRLLKSDLPTIAPMIGVMISPTNDVRSAANAPPMTNAIASVIRLPCIRKSLNSLMTLPICTSRS